MNPSAKAPQRAEITFSDALCENPDGDVDLTEFQHLNTQLIVPKGYNQFEHNKKLLGRTSEYDKEYYTIKLHQNPGTSQNDKPQVNPKYYDASKNANKYENVYTKPNAYPTNKPLSKGEILENIVKSYYREQNYARKEEKKLQAEQNANPSFVRQNYRAGRTENRKQNIYHRLMDYKQDEKPQQAEQRPALYLYVDNGTEKPLVPKEESRPMRTRSKFALSNDPVTKDRYNE